MHKMRKFALILSFLLVVGFCGNAWSWDATDHVSVAPNLKGDLLIFPVYFTGSGWENKITVINTSQTRSVFAKLVMRSAHRSQEIRDFMLFLTPTDVWTGVVYLNATDGRVHITSSDDSCMISDGVFATAAAPLDVSVVDVCAGDRSDIGYIEIIAGGSVLTPTPSPFPKATLHAVYKAWEASLNDYAPTVGVYNGYTVDLPINSLTGLQETGNAAINIWNSLSATVMQNVDYGGYNYVLLENRGSQIMNVAEPSELGRWDNNSLVEYEAALSKMNLVLPYYTGALGSTLITASFPTKLANFPCGVNNWLGPYYGFGNDVRFSLVAYDLQENSISITDIFSPQLTEVNNFPNEVNTLPVSDFTTAVGAFEEGWVLIDFTDDGITTGSSKSCPGCLDISYTGVPVLATSMRIYVDPATGTYAWGSWEYAAHDLGAVTVNGVAEPQYHYFQQADNITAY